jgi:Fe-S-cluster-containing hydrogenase component 2
VLSDSDIRQFVPQPSAERLAAGPVVIVECIERIPCNPCAFACPRKAISINGALTDTPLVDFSKCNGCAACIAKCPGLAIFVVNRDFSPTEATVTLPYELLPRPALHSTVTLLDRSGGVVGRGRVLRMLDGAAQNRCAVITVTVPRKLWNTVRGIRPPRRKLA